MIVTLSLIIIEIMFEYDDKKESKEIKLKGYV